MEPAATEQPSVAVVEKSLPATASTLPTIFILGLMAFAGAFAIRAASQRHR
jgi:hypothetical protein